MFRNIKFTFSLLIMLVLATGLASLFEQLFDITIGGFNLQVLIFPFFILSLFLFAFYVWYFLVQPIEKILHYAQDVLDGRNVDSFYYKKGNLIDEIGVSIHSLAENIDEATSFSIAIGEGNFDQNLEKLNVKEGLGHALQEMRIKLQNVADEEAKRNWSVNGVAIFGELLRKEQAAGFEELSFLYVRQLVKYLQANQGGVYLINFENQNDLHIELIASFAFDRRKHSVRRLEMEEGLVAQCIIEADYIYMDDVPDNYIRISSGLGDSNPRSVLLVPLKTNDIVLGVVEIASFNTFKEYQIDFVKQVAESFAATISTMRVNANTARLLEESHKITEELKAKEEVLHRNSQELRETQSALEVKMVEIEQEAAYTKSIVTAINSTNASLLLDMEGNILEVNQMFLSIMDYKKEELVGKNEISLVAEEEIVSERYKMLMESVKSGSYNSGEYKRISKSGKELWITGSYSPIFDVNGIPIKIVLFAQFTTEQKERELELKSKIDAINSSIATIELDLNCGIISGNAVFMKDFGFKRMDMKGLKFESILEPGFVNSDEFAVLWELVVGDNVMTKPLTLYTKDNQEKQYVANFSPTKNLQGKVYKILVILIDFTDQYLLKEQLTLLLQEEKRKSTLLELQIESGKEDFAEEISSLLVDLQDGIDISPFKIEMLFMKHPVPSITIDANSVVTNVSESIQNILGFKRGEIIGKNILEFTSPTQSELLRRISIFTSRTFRQAKLPLLSSDGKEIIMNTYLVPAVEGVDDCTVMLLVNEEIKSK